MVMSPEHPLIDKWEKNIKNFDKVCEYRQESARKSDFERTEINKEKTGVCLDGVCAINPVNNKEIPIFISDYVLVSYGTGAIMAVPGHDTRDFEFAKKFDLPIIEVVKGGDIEKEAFTAALYDQYLSVTIQAGVPYFLALQKSLKACEEFL